MAKTILIVDDDENYSDMLATYLETNGGYTVCRVSDTSAMASWLGSGSVPDLFIIDMQMPGGGGPAAVKNLRGDPKTANIPIVMISGMPEHQQEKWFLGQPNMKFLHKPVELLDALGYVRDMVKE